jgi:hypothetical protein
MPDENPVPRIILKVTDFEQFNVEVDFQTPSLEFARLMLDTATKTIERLQRDAEAVEFGVRMQQGAAAHSAMLKRPKLVI